MSKNITASLMRSINRSAILELIREASPISRSQIAKDLNMSLPTVMRIVDELMEEELVRSAGAGVSTGGRPSSLIEFNGESHAVIGVDLGGTKMYGMVADLAGNIQYKLFRTHEENREIADGDYVAGLINFIHQLLDAPRPEGQKIRGIGVGAPAITLVPEGIVTWAPSLGWRDLPLREILTEKFDLPVTVENDVNLSALGEWGFGAAKGVNSLVQIAVGTGIGAGIMIDGAIYRGFQQAAGEVGYMLPNTAVLGQVHDGFGALELLASGTGITDRARQLLKKESTFFAPEPLSAQIVFAQAREGKTWAQQVVAETVDYLALTIANVAVVINPEMVVLGGGVAQSADLLVEPIRERLEGVIPFVPKIVASVLGRDAAVMGAIMQVMKATDEYFIVKKLN